MVHRFNHALAAECVALLDDCGVVFGNQTNGGKHFKLLFMLNKVLKNLSRLNKLTTARSFPFAKFRVDR